MTIASPTRCVLWLMHLVVMTGAIQTHDVQKAKAELSSNGGVTRSADYVVLAGVKQMVELSADGAVVRSADYVDADGVGHLPTAGKQKKNGEGHASTEIAAEASSEKSATSKAKASASAEIESKATNYNHNFKLLKADVECGSNGAANDRSMGAKSNVQECANAVSAAGGTFFIFGKGTKAGRCYHEFTKTASCSDPGSGGWENDDYDFFTILNATSLCKAPNLQGAIKHDGYKDSFRGWYDVQGCGKCNDYCRWVGDTEMGKGRDPSDNDKGKLEYGKSWWSCQMGGESNPYTTRKFPLWNLKRCHGMSMPTPRATYMSGKACVKGCDTVGVNGVAKRQCSAMATSLVTISQCRAAAAALGLPWVEIVSASDSRNKFYTLPDGCFKEAINTHRPWEPTEFGVVFNEKESHGVRPHDPKYEILCRDV